MTTQNTEAESVNRTENLTNAVKNAVKGLGAISKAIHSTDVAIFAVLEASSYVGKGGIKGGMLNDLFAVDFKGIDRRRLVTWFETYSPVRPRFETSGKFKDVAWSDSYVKQAKASNKDVFDLVGAAANPWYTMGEAEAGMSLRSKTVDAIATAAIRAMTKTALATSKDGKFRSDVVQEIMNQVIRNIRENGEREALEYASTDNMESWANALMIHKAKAESARIQAEAEAKKIMQP